MRRILKQLDLGQYAEEVRQGKRILRCVHRNIGSCWSSGKERTGDLREMGEYLKDGSDSNKQIYLDYQATTPLDPRVLDAMLPFMLHSYGNPHSSHNSGLYALNALKHAKQVEFIIIIIYLAYS